MTLNLLYKGPLLATNNREKRLVNKQEIRRSIHGQLRYLWKNPPLDLHYISARGKTFKVGDFTFQPTISELLGMTCELDIKLLTRGKMGSLIRDADLDNRLKTIFDALQLPQHLHELPINDKPSTNENPFYVLLENDAQITNVCIRSEPLLVPPAEDEKKLIFI